jgi:Fic family protein
MVTIKPNKAKALMLARREVATFVYDAVQLEGINFTLPEVQTLMEGVTVGGHALSDQQITVNQSQAWKQLFIWLKQDQFAVTAAKACELHNIAAKEEALEWGQFRSGGVTIAGTEHMPPKSNELTIHFDKMLTDMALIDDCYDQAIHIFLTMARCQFFYDVNKRMGRFMMNGLLLANGYPAINLPFSRRHEFNQLMLTFYSCGEQQPMNAFLRSCLDPRAVAIMNE